MPEDWAPVSFLVVTVLLGGSAAWIIGRALALSWSPLALALAYTLPLAAAVRFLHFVLVEGALLSPRGLVIDLAVTAALAAAGFRRTRARQMTTQYGWLFARAGPWSWRAREPEGTRVVPPRDSVP
jgi:hypothetical protein